MEVKPLFKPRLQTVSFHKVDDVDGYMFDHEQEESDCLFTVWADGEFNPKEFDGVELIRISELKKAIQWLKDDIKKNTDGKLRTSNYQVSDLMKLINEVFSDLSTFDFCRANHKTISIWREHNDFNNEDDFEELLDKKWCSLENLKSAVEWLKENITSPKDNYTDIIEKIDIAFEDVMNDGK